MTLLSIGDEVREGTYRLHSLFPRAVNFTDGRRLVTLVTPDIGAGPVNIVVRDLTPFALPHAPTPDSTAALAHSRATTPNPDRNPGPRPAPFLSPCPGRVRSTPHIRGAHVRSGDTDLRVERYSVVFANRRFLLSEAQSYGSLLHIQKETSLDVFRRNLKLLETILTGESHPKSLAFLLDENRVRNFRAGFERNFVAQIKAAAPRMFTTAGVRKIAGCGIGLTPSGDDFIAGVLIGLNVLQRLAGRGGRGLIQRIHRAAKSQSLLSNAFLRLARDGRVNEKMQRMISLLSARGGSQLAQSARAVLDTGETSGADLLTGFVLTVKRY